MPTKRKQNRKKPRTRARRKPVDRSNRLVRHALIGRSLGFPSKNTVQLRYVTCVELENSVGALDVHAFRANSIFDPDVTGVGHQPLGRDQWFDFYNHYRVVKSRMAVEYCSKAQTTGQSPAVSGLYLADDLTVPTQWTTLVESGRGSYNTAHSINTQSYNLEANYSQSSFYKGQGKNQSQLGAAQGATPSEQAFFILYQQPCDEGDNGSIRSYTVVIDYLVEYSEPKDLAQS